MKHTMRNIAPGYLCGIMMLGFLATTTVSCKKSYNSPPTPSHEDGINYEQVNLVADQASAGAVKTDPNLVNPWGIAVSPTGVFWISANHAGVSTVYDTTGNSLIPAVTIPAPGGGAGAPTGQVFNNTPNFFITAFGKVSKFIFATEDGTIAAWGGGPTAFIVGDRSAANAVYKGLAIANTGTANFIYAADFKNGKVDVYDSTFKYVAGMTLTDPTIPAGFAPFNVKNIGGMLYVTYAKQKGPDNEDDQAGAGNGYIDIFQPDGTFVKRFAGQGTLNSPWGIAVAGTDFGQGLVSPILVGNFGDGRINVFQSDGTYVGQLQSAPGTPIVIDGLWDLFFPANGVPNVNPYRLYFTAGPAGENHGLFGYLKLK